MKQFFEYLAAMLAAVVLFVLYLAATPDQLSGEADWDTAHNEAAEVR